MQRIPRNGGNSQLVIELAEAHEKPFVLEAVLIRPRRNSAGKDSGRINVPLLDILRESRGNGRSQTRPKQSAVQLVGISAGAEFELSLKTFAAKALAPIAVKDFNPGANPPFGLKPPAFAFRMTRPTTLVVNLKPRIPQRQVRQSQIGRIRRGRLEWKLTAMVETSSAPAYDHRISVDPRLRIREITVLEDQAPRLVRWSRIGDKVILFLSDQTTDSQTVSITAGMPIPESGLTRLPTIRFLNADTRESHLSLYRDDDVGVEIAEIGHWKQAKFPAAQFLPDTGSRLLGTYSSHVKGSSHVNGPMPEIRTVRRNRRIRVDSVYRLHQQTGDSWALTAVFRFSQTSSPATPVRLHLPREWAENARIESENLRVESHRNADGSRDVTLHAQQPSSSAEMVSVTCTVHRPRQRQWSLPEIRIDDAVLRENYFLLLTESEQFSVSSPAVSRLPASFPQWAVAVLPQQTDASMRGFFQKGSSDWSLTTRTARKTSPQPFIALMETHTWIVSDERENGRTAMLLLGRWKDPFAVSLPDGVTVRAVVVNGESFRPGSPSQNRLAVKIDPARSEQIVVLHWTRERTAPVWWPQRTTVPFPSPVGVVVKRSLASLVCPRGYYLFATDRLEKHDGFQHRLERLEGLLEACRLVLQHENRRPALWENTQQSFRNVQRELAARRQIDNDVDSATSARLERADKSYQKLLRSLQRLPIPSRLVGADSASGNLAFSLPISPDEGSVIHGRFSPSEQTLEELDASFWVVDARLVSWLIALGLFLLIVLFLRRLLKPDTAELLALREPLAWVALGLVWWFCLTPGFVGMLFILAAGGRAVYLRFHPHERPAPIIEADSVSTTD
ncbi:MAG: hypothetical protein IID45_05170 [Planctomycetes bacterium]|nr:hypothetical protein [Planctomycetota bacterium]